MISADAHAAILRKVASTAVDDARAAWKMARTSPTETHVRAAFRACVFADRALRSAADALPDEAAQMLEEADRIGAAADKLKGQMVRIVETDDATK